MELHHILLILHLVSAAIWVGGHLLISIGYLPDAMSQNNPQLILAFEQRYEKIGMPALLLLVVTGIWMAMDFGITPAKWFDFNTPLEIVVSLKLTLLLTTAAFAISAQKFAIPRLKAGGSMRPMAVHIICVTLIGVAMLILGSFMRYGGL